MARLLTDYVIGVVDLIININVSGSLGGVTRYRVLTLKGAAPSSRLQYAHTHTAAATQPRLYN